MTAVVSRALMVLAGRCLGASRREWRLAMQAEFEEAVDDGKPLAFAAGCLIAAWREMVSESEGRLMLTTYALALGLLLPMAALQFEQAIACFMLLGKDLPEGMLTTSAGRNPYLIWSQNSAVPALVFLRLLLGVAQLCLAWVLLDGDWPRVVKCGALIGAATITLSLFMGVLMLDQSPLIAQIAERSVELAAIVAIARGHARLLQAPHVS
jgi:hypothetical protein